MRKWLFSIGLCLVSTTQAQNTEADSLKRLLFITKEDTSRVMIYEALSYAYLSASPDTALRYASTGLNLAKKSKDLKGEGYCINAIGNVYFYKGDYNKALQIFLQALKIRESLHDERTIAVTYSNIGSVYSEQGEYQQAISYILKTKQYDEKIKDSAGLLIDLFNLGSVYDQLKNTDSALFYEKKAYEIAESLNDKNYIGAIMNAFGSVYRRLDSFILAITYYRQAIVYAKPIKDQQVLSAAYNGLAQIFYAQGLSDSSLFYCRLALVAAKEASLSKSVLDAEVLLSSLFKAAYRYDSAFYYQESSMKIKDSLFSNEKIRQIEKIRFQEQQRQQSIENAKLEYRNKIKLYVVLSTSAFFLLLALIFWRNNIAKQKALLLLKEQQQETDKQKEKVEEAYEELKATQRQLIHSEKMASLGELTAGIAHEIQNPLNFVNNFSDVNKELLTELKDEADEGNVDQVKAIANNVIENEKKINHHGKRADAIVKSMLQHSRQTKGVKEPTDINALCQEYLRLSYHGMRAKDKNFNSDFKTDFDESIGKINIVQQDIGRALLNLYNNAFYAVNEKQKAESIKQNADYKPLVSVQTQTLDDKIEINVTDNGNGIPQNIVDKIFQPFFTTKPTGQGTGLGLSLAYDIITKEHNGTIKAESKEGEGSKFIIQLPVV